MMALACRPTPHAATLRARAFTRRRFVSSAPVSVWGPQPPAPKPYLVTTPIYYVNSVPHIGHLYSSLLADSVARYRRLATGAPVLLSTGTDEHGLKVQEAARDRGLAPRALCDDVSAAFRAMHRDFDVSVDDFVRTSEARHHRVVRWLWRRLTRRGAVYVGRHEGWYCRSDEAFLTDTQVVSRADFERRRDDAAARAGDAKSLGGGQLHAPPPAAATAAAAAMVSAESGHAVEWLSEENYMFRLAAARPAVLAWLDGGGGESPVAPAQRHNEVRAFLLDAPLTDLSVSRRRDKVSWAIPVPYDAAHSVYVWVDALSSYLTVASAGSAAGAAADAAAAAAAAAGDADAAAAVDLPDDAPWEALFPAWPADVHVVGKDILRFHAVYWPALLLAAGLPPPRRVLAHGHWTVGQVKMSKSLGNVVAPRALVPPLGPHAVDAVRYCLLKEGGVGGDGDFGPNVLHRAAVVDCADTLGNLASRVLNPALLPTGALPAAPPAGGPDAWVAAGLMTGDERALAARCGAGGVAAAASAAYAAVAPGVALTAVIAVVAEANRVFAAAEPWALVRRRASAGAAAAADAASDAGRARRLSVVLYLALEVLRVAAVLLQPAMPTAAARLLDRLGAAGAAHPARQWGAAAFGALAPGDYAVDTASGPFIMFAKAVAPAAPAAARPLPARARPATSTSRHQRAEALRATAPPPPPPTAAVNAATAPAGSTNMGGMLGPK